MSLLCITAGALTAGVLLLKSRGTESVVVVSEKTSEPNMTVKWDFGTIESGTAPQHTFRIANRTGGVLHLEPAGVSCSALAFVDCDERVLPGEYGQITLRVESDSLDGKRKYEGLLHVSGTRRLLVRFALGLHGPGRKAGPVCYLDESHHDFGIAYEGSEVSHRFPVRNYGTVPLSLGETRASCGACLTVKKEKDSIAPGEQGAILVTLDTSGKRGRVSQRAFVLTNDPDMGLLRLTVHATVPSAWAEPEFLPLGRVRAGTAVEDVLRVYTSGVDGGHVTHIRCEDPAVTAGKPRCDLISSRVGQNVYTVPVHWDTSGGGIGLHRYRIVARTDVRGSDTVIVRAEGHIDGRVTVRPGHLFFGLVKPGQSVVRKCTIRFPPALQRSAAALVLRADSDDLSISTTTTHKEPGQPANVTVTLQPSVRTANAGPLEGTIDGFIADDLVLSISYSAVVGKATDTSHRYRRVGG